tara:strand:+ start:440 stop:1822 length:1383 start_codon:yes stop_codon:yes gene_type:complete
MEPLFKVWLYQPPASRLKKQQAASGNYPIKIVVKRMHGLDERWMRKTGFSCPPKVFKALWPKAGDSITNETLAIGKDFQWKLLKEAVDSQLNEFKELIEGVTLENCQQVGLTSIKAFKSRFLKSRKDKVLKVLPTDKNNRSLKFHFDRYCIDNSYFLKRTSKDRFNSAFNSFNEFCRFNYTRLWMNLSIDDIDVEFMRKWEKWMRNPKSHNDKKRRTKITIAGYAKNLLAVLNDTADRAEYGYSKDLIPIGPNRKEQWQIPTPTKNEATIPQYLDEVDLKKFKDYKPTSEQEQLAKDVWFLCYYGGGCYMADLVFMQKDFLKEKEKKLIYYRTKNDGKPTSSVGIVPLRKEFLELVERYKDDDASDFLLNFNKRYEDIETASSKWRKFLLKYWHRIAKKLEFKTGLNLKMARHTCHTNLRRAGGSYAEIQEISQHKTEKMLQNYLHQFNNKRMEELFSKI